MFIYNTDQTVLLFFSSCKNMARNNTCDTNRTTLFSLICVLWFHKFELDYLSIFDSILISEYIVSNYYML